MTRRLLLVAALVVALLLAICGWLTSTVKDL